jgi:subtilase family serine protease
VALAAATGLLVLICSLSATIAASAHSGPRRVGSAPLFPRGARSLGALPTATKIPVDITLDPSDPAALSAYARAVSTPGSPDYHHFLTVAQFRQRFAPSDSEIATVRAGLEAAGLEPGPVSANGLLLQVRAPASQLASAFDTSFEQVQLASGRVAYANTSAPRLSASLSNLVQGVVGLNNLVLPHALGIQAARPVGHVRADATPGGTAHASASVTDCPSADALATSNGPYTDQNVATTYGFSSLYAAGDEGAGQTVGLLELEPFTRSDIRGYNACYGINGGLSSDVMTINVSDGSSSGASGQQVGEAALDIEQVLGLAPAATVDVYSAPNDVQGVINAYTEMVQSSTVSVISTSWGECEEAIGSATAQAEQTLFQEAATEGKSVYAAAGDDGSSDCDYPSSPNPSALAVDDPGSDPYVTSVGGTSLTSADPASQTAWNDSYGAGGGGVSALWTMPTYQGGASASLGVISSASSTSSCAAATGNTGAYCRQVPDVSADADPATGYLIYYKGAWTAYGGTSAAVPLWAALTALANASSACSAGPVGFVNPVLYSLAGNASAYANDFTDVTSGNNDFTPSGYTGGEFSADDGYDMASGLGTPNGTSLIPALCGVADGGGTGTTVTQTVTTGTTTTVTQTVTTGTTTTVTAPGTTTTVTAPGTTTTVTEPGTTTTVTEPGTTTTVTAPGTTTTVTEPGTTTTVTAPGTTTTVTAPGTTTTVTAPGTTTTVTAPGITSTVTKIVTVPGPTQTVYYPEPSPTVTRTVTVTVTASATPKVTATEPKAGQTDVAVGLSCPSGGTACTVTGSLTAATALKSLRSARSRQHLTRADRAKLARTRAARAKLARTRTVTLASAHLTVAAGRQATLKLSLDAAGKLMLKRAKKLTLTLHLTSDGKTLATHAIAFTAAKAK